MVVKNVKIKTEDYFDNSTKISVKNSFIYHTIHSLCFLWWDAIY